MKGKSRLLLGALVMCITNVHAVTESSQAVAVPQVQAATTPASASRTRVAVGKFDNRSAYMRGIFSNGTDQLGEQAKTILVSHLQQTNRFSVLDRENIAEARQEAAYQGKAQAIKGADYVITGSTASDDSTLNGKVLDLAMREAINKLSAAIDSGAWAPGRLCDGPQTHLPMGLLPSSGL